MPGLYDLDRDGIIALLAGEPTYRADQVWRGMHEGRRPAEMTDLPRPLVDLRKGLQGDTVAAAVDLRKLREDTAMTEEEVEAVLSRLSGLRLCRRRELPAITLCSRSGACAPLRLTRPWSRRRS